MKTLHIIPKTDDAPSSSLSVRFYIPTAPIADVFKTEGQAQVSRDEKKRAVKLLHEKQTVDEREKPDGYIRGLSVSTIINLFNCGAF
jgi:hypothetical protein